MSVDISGGRPDLRLIFYHLSRKPGKYSNLLIKKLLALLEVNRLQPLFSAKPIIGTQRAYSDTGSNEKFIY